MYNAVMYVKIEYIKTIYTKFIYYYEMDPIKCFTDASYSQHKNLSTIGYKIGGSNIFLENLLHVKNTQAELYAIKKCIEVFNNRHPGLNAIIFTDCQRALKDSYPLNISVQKIDGHKQKIYKNDDDIVFSTVDKAVRKRLRSSGPLN